jgi:hypothetical protein
VSKRDQNPTDRDPLGLRVQGAIFVAAVPLLLVALAVGGAAWYHYLIFLGLAAFIWATVFRFAPWWFNWVRGDTTKP